MAKKKNDLVTITCYGRTERMERSEAIAKYYDAMTACEGCEAERYKNLYTQLVEGETICFDTEIMILK